MRELEEEVSDRDFFTPSMITPKKTRRKREPEDLLYHSSPYYKMDISRKQGDVTDENLINSAEIPFAMLDSRICSLAIGPNYVYMGTVGGHVQVAVRETGEILDNFKWRQMNTPIEGLMFDYEGKVIYATEFNLVVLDKNFSQVLKEVQSYEPLRT